ncbi:8e24cfb8-6e60-43a5-82f2-8fb8803694db-CDS [Sclerotinia trifoliorum]|uniref:8e24cfb8-6e60-43a5-82f2-8fb8803694db-CDS n=1 Tax=Sclerotinia trifoliorum TaxID=28548 RepID=A0A8H2W4N9_9HELO|nr:8e24cfb8-6e60-43a5-82f2-8fb8803694db-CDS [Sclerotinia trifoliorum]
MKQGYIDKNIFENIIVEFISKFENLRPLTCELRYILLSTRDGVVFTSTFQDYNIMYNKMITVFNKAIGFMIVQCITRGCFFSSICYTK